VTFCLLILLFVLFVAVNKVDFIVCWYLARPLVGHTLVTGEQCHGG